MNNLNTEVLGRWSIGIDSPKAHNCPNCQCGNNHNQQTRQVIISRQQSPVIERFSPTQKLNLGQPNVLMKTHSPENIYFRRTDLNASNTSINSSSSISKEKNAQPIRVSIRYSSPARDSKKDFNNPVSKIPYVIYPQKNIVNHNQEREIKNNYIPSLYHTKTYEYNNVQRQRESFGSWNEDEPPTPNILKRKTSGLKKSIQIEEKNISSPRIYRENELNKISGIYKNSFPATDNKNREVRGSVYRMLLEDNEEKTLMQELSNDLKLNYDYLETADISNDSVS